LIDIDYYMIYDFIFKLSRINIIYLLNI